MTTPTPTEDARFSRVLDQNQSPNVYIRMGDPTGRRVVVQPSSATTYSGLSRNSCSSSPARYRGLVRPCVQLVVDWVKECSR